MLERARAAGYRTYLHVLLVPKALAVARVRNRVETGGHDVPQRKIEERFDRLWPSVAGAVAVADEATAYDSSRGSFTVVARYSSGSVGRDAHLAGLGTAGADQRIGSRRG